MGAVIGPPGEAMEELDSPYRRSCAVVPVEPTGCCSRAPNAPSDLRPGEKWRLVEHKENLTIPDLLPASPLGDPPFRN